MFLPALAAVALPVATAWSYMAVPSAGSSSAVAAAATPSVVSAQGPNGSPALGQHRSFSPGSGPSGPGSGPGTMCTDSNCLSACSMFNSTSGFTACDYKSNNNPGLSRLAFHCFVDAFYVKNNFTAALTTYADVNMIQHNPSMQDGRASEIAAFANATMPSTPWTILHEQWDNFTAILHTKMAGGPNVTYAVADIWRMQGPCLMEHWDVMQQRPNNSTNPHPLF